MKTKRAALSCPATSPLPGCQNGVFVGGYDAVRLVVILSPPWAGEESAPGGIAKDGFFASHRMRACLLAFHSRTSLMT
jgi:hypothetical protein